MPRRVILLFILGSGPKPGPMPGPMPGLMPGPMPGQEDRSPVEVPVLLGPFVQVVQVVRHKVVGPDLRIRLCLDLGGLAIDFKVAVRKRHAAIKAAEASYVMLDTRLIFNKLPFDTDPTASTQAAIQLVVVLLAMTCEEVLSGQIEIVSKMILSEAIVEELTASERAAQELTVWERVAWELTV
ncbi:hypothetical protein TASIC1_0006041900 [Trichoderma asperellum]|uniref:Uncharacterized protein n=1 Tax=Trichoderma asperellum TaxID=101201 RepID=A0A6V8QV37_TRIAP|nr:hypothetical protein TASIC1_0006041900 [Trichoderma asperellum]